jgi:hypothetical protein
MDERVEAFLADVRGPCGRRGAIPEYLLFGTPIEPDDAVFLCIHFQPKSERREESSPLRSAERTHD